MNAMLIFNGLHSCFFICCPQARAGHPGTLGAGMLSDDSQPFLQGKRSREGWVFK